MMQKFFNYSFLVLICFYFQGCKPDPCNKNPCAIDESGATHGQPLEDFRDCICLCDQYWHGDDCSVPCFENGTFNEFTGTCDCIDYYEGIGCETKWKSKFLNNNGTSLWDVSDTCFSPGFIYTVKVEPGAADTNLLIFNVGNVDPDSSIKVGLTNRLKFYQSNEAIIGSFTISRLSGVISSDGNKIQVTYTAETGSNVLDCEATWTRR